MAEKKMTRAQAVEFAIEVVREHEGEYEAIEVLETMHAQLTKPRKKSDAPTKARLVNENLAAKCVAAMEGHEKVTSNWLLEHVSGWPTTTPQKVTAVMKIAIDNGEVIKIKEGKTVYYSLAE
jgi:hypothetical protein